MKLHRVTKAKDRGWPGCDTMIWTLCMSKTNVGPAGHHLDPLCIFGENAERLSWVLQGHRKPFCLIKYISTADLQLSPPVLWILILYADGLGLVFYFQIVLSRAHWSQNVRPLLRFSRWNNQTFYKIWFKKSFMVFMRNTVQLRGC